MKIKLYLLAFIGTALMFYSLNAQTWSVTKRLTWNVGISSRPSIAIDPSNNIHIVWQDSTPGNSEIYYRKSTNGGVIWSEAKRLTWNSGSSGTPAISADSNHNIHVVWYDNTPGESEIYYRKSTNGGASWLGAKRLTWNLARSFFPSIAIDSGDNILLAWHSLEKGQGTIYYIGSVDGGVSWSAAKRLTWDSAGSYRPSLIIDSSDNIHVVWYSSATGGSEIYYRKSTNGGASWLGAKRLTWTPGSSEIPVISADSNHNIHVSWCDYTPGNYDIYYRRSTNGGASWLGAKRLTWNSGNSVAPQMTADSGDNIQVVWYDYTPGGSEIYYMRSTNRGVSWAGTKRLTWNSGSSVDPQVTVDSSNNIHVIWSDWTPGNQEIYYKKSF